MTTKRVDPVNESSWTEQELASVRSALRADVARLRAEVSSTQHVMYDEMRESAEDFGDETTEVGSTWSDIGAETSVVDNASEIIAQSERAIARIASGQYGVCETCGRPIAKPRLEAFPRATLCVTCQEAAHH